MVKKIVIALGGNAILNRGERGSFEEQEKNVKKTAAKIFSVLKDKNISIAITHGNGPQIGNLLVQQASAAHAVPAMPMFVCDAMTQGQLGHLIEQSLSEQLAKNGISRSVATLLTHVAVDARDSAFLDPTKPVGPFYTMEEAQRVSKDTGYIFKEDAAKSWWRRVVASPAPVGIQEFDVIKKLFDEGVVVVAGGGGGIPIAKQNGYFYGVDAVVDKDRMSALLADLLGADTLIILTNVEQAALYYGTEKEKKIGTMNLKEAKHFLKEGHFGEGSMKPKIEAAVYFVEKGAERKTIITTAEKLHDATEGKAGTMIVG